MCQKFTELISPEIQKTCSKNKHCNVISRNVEQTVDTNPDIPILNTN